VESFGRGYERDSVVLTGEWDVLPGHGDEEVWRAATADALAPWHKAHVPGALLPEMAREKARPVDYAWARRRFQLSARQASRNAVLRWGGVDFGATAWLNGRRVGQTERIGPFTVHLPENALKTGQNELLLRVSGWPSVPRGQSGYPLVPTGSSITGWGGKQPTILDDVWIEFYDRAYLATPLPMADPGSETVTFRIWPEARGGLPEGALLTATVKDAATNQEAGHGSIPLRESTRPTDIRIAVSQTHPWTPDDPHLYTAQLTAEAGGQTLDRVEFPFGMRQFEIVDGHFRLNGEPIRLHGSNLVYEWRWGERFNAGVKRYIVDEARAMNLRCFRTHARPAPELWLRTADEHGTMILLEMPVLYNYQKFDFTPEEWDTFHRNVLADTEAWMRKMWNHPSIVIWVLSNESNDAEWESGPYYRRARALDPTRPCVRTGQATPDIVDLHLCGNFSSGCEGWLPRTVRNKAESKDADRPLTDTEYMNIFGPRRNIHRRWLGRADHPYAKYIFAEFGLEHTEAHRRCDYDCVLPYMYAGWTRLRGNDWRADYPTPMAAALHSSMAPVLASLDLFDRNFVAGRRQATPLRMINDLGRQVTARVDLYLTPENPLFVPDPATLEAATWHKGFEHTFPAHSNEPLTVRWPVPQTEGTWYLAAVVTRDGDRPVVSQRTVRAVPGPRADAELRGRTVTVFGAEEPLVRWFEGRDIAHRASEADTSPAGDVALVWTPSKETLSAGDAARLRRFAEAGGRVAVVEPTEWHWPELAEVELSEADSSRAFPYDGTADELLGELDPECLKRWNGGVGRIADRCIEGRAAESAERLLWVENRDRCVALRLPAGEGEVIITTLQIPRQLSPGGVFGDPAAEQILLNLLGG